VVWRIGIGLGVRLVKADFTMFLAGGGGAGGGGEEKRGDDARSLSLPPGYSFSCMYAHSALEEMQYRP
jgi:hypothetical protein